ncbi:protein-tyrosine phosphatase family protein [Actinomadura luteofluorescens]|uniref:phosphatase domain-containing protein n=1 Tax=Actinomadura luteofluorescens TaxID=46163 RepID=UPI003627A5C7
MRAAGRWPDDAHRRDPAPGRNPDPGPRPAEPGPRRPRPRLRALPGLRAPPPQARAALGWPSAWIDWPDFLLPRDRDEAVRQIRALHERARSGATAEVACGGGVGRTGTVIACLAVLSGVAPSEAVAWAREHHHPRAVETPGNAAG